MQVPVKVTNFITPEILNTGSNPANIINVGGVTFFTATDANNITGLWRLNGTQPATLVSNIRLGSQPGLNDLAPVAINGELYFANSDINNNVELWKVSPNPLNPTEPIAPVRLSLPQFTASPRFSNLTNSNGSLYLIANETPTSSSLWTVDFNGNPLRMANLPNLRNVGNIINFNGRVFFTAINSATSLTNPNPTTELFTLNRGGVVSPIRQIGTSSILANARNFVNVNGTLYFTANDSTTSTNQSVWRLDSRFSPVRVMGSSTYLNPSELVSFGGTLYFTAEQQTGERKLWRLDRNGAAIRVLEPSTINSFTITSYRNLVIANDSLFFLVNNQGVSELWQVDNFGGRSLRAATTATNVSNLTNINGSLFFSGRGSTGGQELWVLERRTDGSFSSMLVSDINIGAGSSNPNNITAIDNTILFSADNGRTGQELWQINTNGQSLRNLTDINTRNRQVPTNLINVNDTLYFTYTTPVGMELWRIDKATGKEIKVTTPYNFSNISNLTVVNNSLYFMANEAAGARIWRVDNTNPTAPMQSVGTANTNIIFEQLVNSNGLLFVVTGNTSNSIKSLMQIDGINTRPIINLPTSGILAPTSISNIVNFNGLPHFTTTRADGSAQLFRINSSNSVEQLNIPISSSSLAGIRQLTIGNNRLHFVAEERNGRRTLWSMTSEPNRLPSYQQISLPFSTTGISPSLHLSQLMTVGSSLHFVAQNGTLPPELWRLDDAGRPVMVMRSAIANQSNFENLTDVSGTLYFTNNSGRELWKIEPQRSPLRLSVLGTGEANFNISNLTNINGNLYLNVNNATSGREMWRVEANNTLMRISDNINPGAASSNPSNFTYADGKLYFAAENTIDGVEIWSIDVGFPNIAPTLNDTNLSQSVNEDAPFPFGQVGFLVSSIVRTGEGGNITDPDSQNLGIAITGTTMQNGSWFYSTDNGVRWLSLDSRQLVNSNALLLAADTNTRLYFRPFSNYSGVISNAITFRAWDRSTGSNGSFANTGSNGGFTAFSRTVDTVSMTVNQINDAPVISKGYIFSIPDNYDNGTMLGTPAAFDVDLDNLTWNITGGNIDSDGDGVFAFSIDENSGQISISDRDEFNPSTTPSFRLTLSVNDGTVTVSDTVDIKLVRTAGDLDPSFGLGSLGLGGKYINEILQSARDIKQLADGKFLTLGIGINNSTGLSQLGFVRHNSDGSIDETFGDSGRAFISIPGINLSSVTEMQLQADGKILIVGNGTGVDSSDFFVARFNPNATLDTSFGNNGVSFTNINGTGDDANAIAIQADGKILVAGRAWNGSNHDFAVVRYNSDGFLDTNFGNGGRAITAIGTSTDTAEAIAIQADGKILVSGWANHSQGVNFALVRYNSDGTLDTRFGNGGTVLDSTISSFNYSYTSAIQADGKILVAGNMGSQLGMARYNTDGTLDTSFGTGGLATTMISDSSAIARQIHIQADGRIIVTGDTYSITSRSQEFALARYNPDGSLDSGFGNSGRVYTPVGNRTQDFAYASTIQADGKIVLAGASDNELALVRYEGGSQTQRQTLRQTTVISASIPPESVPPTSTSSFAPLIPGTLKAVSFKPSLLNRLENLANNSGWKLDSLLTPSQIDTWKHNQTLTTGGGENNRF